jgi:uncharacterized membrane protein YgcG
LRQLDLKFGAAPKHSGYLTDQALILSAQSNNRLCRLLQLFQSRFPQSLFSAFLTELPARTPLEEYIFWLANRVHFSSGESIGENNFDLLLVVDAAGGEAGLAIGYGLESFVGEETLRDALAAGRAAFARQDWSAGIERCVDRMTESLREISGRSERR